jgi:hypothetical protein
MTILHPLPVSEDGDPPVVVLASCDCHCVVCFEGRHCYFPPCNAGTQGLAEVLPIPLQSPPAVPASLVLTACRCGNVTERGHGAIGARRGFTCDEVRAIRRRVEARAAQPHRAVRRLFRRIRGGAA